MINLIITDMEVWDIRFPTSEKKDGSDAMHPDPDYSCTYVVLKTNQQRYKGYGLTFTLGRGNEIVAEACHSLFPLVKGHTTTKIYSGFGIFWRKLTSDSQLRWIGPEKGVVHLATAAIVNALWDLWARIEDKPVWKLLVDMTPDELVSTMDFRYIRDTVTEEYVKGKLKQNEPRKKELEETIRQTGYPAYTTQAGWLGYTDEKVEELCRKSVQDGFKGFKLKVGRNLADDMRRCKIVREVIGYENKLMLDANQVWDVDEAITWMEMLAKYSPFWIEEPTSPDDALGHAEIRKKLKTHDIGIASGEMCANRIVFKQFLKCNGMDFCQVDAARIGGVNELLAVYFMAEKAGVPVCPHTGGVGLSEMILHLQIWDYICLSQTDENRMIEYVDQQHEHFRYPNEASHGVYQVPMAPGYSTELKQESIQDFIYSTSNSSQRFQDLMMQKKMKKIKRVETSLTEKKEEKQTDEKKDETN
ncbi:mitochondrial enolase superfamily member 1 [Ooceraea biroi]|uniref:L-fuconate dehydratase n=1 Tax=Ooceraea biroi TaxID=2015173 RepID=A0A026W6L7_OOCBI|nr:mitochondrial enolase superfamily member 1 [Ooceraea biroi]EZA51276.1 Mitochondrial enolase superfamily member [Ooceraea biroi]